MRWMGRARAALLLEVVVALAIMVAAMGVLGAQMLSGLRMTAEADRRTRAGELADRLLALVELTPELQQTIVMETTTEGDFGDDHPGWFWQITVEPTELDGLGLVRAEVLHQEDTTRPDDRDGAVVVRQIALLKAAPGRIDLINDFGMDEEDVSKLAASLPMDLDLTSIDPQTLVTFFTQNPEMLLTMLPELMPLMQMFSGGMALAGGPGGSGDLSALAGQFGGLEGLEQFGEQFSSEDAAESLSRLGDLAGGAGGNDAAGTGQFRPGSGGASPPPIVGAPPPGRRGGRGPERIAGNRRGGARTAGGGTGSEAPPAEQPRYTIDDLLRMRDEQTRRQQGGR